MEETHVSHSASFDPAKDLRILLVEDEVLSQTLTVQILQREGHSVFVAATGLAAIEAVKQQEFDLVLIDLGLPDMEGLAALRCLRSSTIEFGNPSTVLWVISGESDASVVAEANASGAETFLKKPVQPEELVLALRGVPRESGSRNTDGKPEQLSADPDNFGDLMKNAGQDIDLATSLVELFLRDFDSLEDGIKSAFQQQDVAKLARESHSLKSPSRLFGAMAMHELCDCVEQSAKKNDHTTTFAFRDRFLIELTRLRDTVLVLQKRLVLQPGNVGP